MYAPSLLTHPLPLPPPYYLTPYPCPLLTTSPLTPAPSLLPHPLPLPPPYYLTPYPCPLLTTLLRPLPPPHYPAPPPPIPSLPIAAVLSLTVSSPVTLGADVTLTCLYNTTPPTGPVTWTINGQRISNDSHFVVYNHILEVKGIDESVSGVTRPYQCRASGAISDSIILTLNSESHDRTVT